MCQEDEDNKNVPTNELVGVLSLSRREPVCASLVCKPLSFHPRELAQAELHGAAASSYKVQSVACVNAMALKRAGLSSAVPAFGYLRHKFLGPWQPATCVSVWMCHLPAGGQDPTRNCQARRKLRGKVTFIISFLSIFPSSSEGFSRDSSGSSRSAH